MLTAPPLSRREICKDTVFFFVQIFVVVFFYLFNTATPSEVGTPGMNVKKQTLN